MPREVMGMSRGVATTGSRRSSLRRLAVAMHRQAIQAQLMKALEGSEEKVDLFHAALLVAQLDNAALDIEAYRQQLSDMAGEIVARLPARADDAAKLTTLKNYLFAGVRAGR